MTIAVHWPQAIYLLLSFIGLMASLVNHGKPSEPEDFSKTLLATAVVMGLLVWGGFFR